MKQAIILIVFLAWSPVYGAGDFEVGVHGGGLFSYEQSGLHLGENRGGNQMLVGSQIYIANTPVFNFIASVDYSWHQESYFFYGQEMPFEMRDMAVTISAVYPLRFGALTAYGGGGIGSHSISYSYRRPATLSLADNGIRIPEASTYFGYHALAGARTTLPHLPVGVFAEGRLTHIDSPDGAIRYATITTGLFLPLQ
jgi:opacity protein-like surface antigen